MFTSITRIIKFAFNNFSRNKGISIATTFVLVVAIMVVTSLYFFQGITNHLTSQIRDKIDITAYFKENATEQDILNVREEILKTSPNIKSVEYISKEKALQTFSERYQDSEVLQTALVEVGENPFLSSLNIVTSGDPTEYEEISNTLETSVFSNLIYKVDFYQKKDTIEKVYSITSNINRAGIVMGIVLIIISILVVFNTVKLAIDSSKDEINTMKIVGATDWFIRGPFIAEGIIYGFIAFLVCFVLSGFSSFLLSPKVFVILPGFNLFDYFLTNFWIFVLIQLIFGIGVGVVSSLVVVKKYLKV
jgi:cell division transport system permease protein